MQHERPFLNDAGSEGGAHEARRFVGRTGGIRLLVNEIASYLASVLACRPDVCGDAELLIAEALNNIEEHGYAAESGMPVQVTVWVLENAIHVATRDFGVPMPGLTVPPMQRPDVDVDPDALPEGGFGWYMIHKLAPNPSYTRRGSTNLLFFKLRFRLLSPELS